MRLSPGLSVVCCSLGLTVIMNSTGIISADFLKLGSLDSKAWFPYDRWRSLTIAGIASKVFSDRNDHMETKFSFCQRSPTIPATANDRNDHDRWDRIRVYLCDRSDRERSSAIAKS